MALALLRPAGQAGGQLQFDITLGRNRYYAYAIGDGEVDRSGGFTVLLNRKVTSPVRGPIPEHPSGRATLEIPADEFDRDNQYVQLASYRTAGRDGPAVSEILKVPFGGVPQGGEDFPTLSLGMGSDMQRFTQRQPVSFRYVEARPMSQAMFLDALLPILQRALPVVKDIIPMVGNLFGGGNGAGGGTAVAAKPSAETERIFALLQQLLAQLAGGQAPSAAKSLAYQAEYSEAQILPLLAAAPMLTQLMPLLQQVLTPETVKAVVDSVSPAKVIGAVTDSLKEVGKLGLENNKMLQDWLAKLDPGVDDPSLDKLLSEMSLPQAVSLARSLSATATPEKLASAEPRYRRIPAVTIDFTGAATVPVGGRTKLCYRTGSALAFPLSITTPRPIHDARLILLVKDPATRRIVVKQRLVIPDVAAGPLQPTPTIAADQAAALTAGGEYLVCAYLLWRNKAKKMLGTSRAQLVTMVGKYTLDRVEDDGALIPLKDTVKHRDYWHKVWQGSFTTDFRRASFECKYYTVLEPERTMHARMETLTKVEEPVERKLVGRLKSGFIASPAALNQLIPLVSSYPLLNDDELAVLRTSEFQERFHQAARFKAELHGRSGATAALWVYPEIKMQKVVCYEATRVGADGQVREFAEHVMHVPMPALLHYIGARTQS